MTDRIDQLGDRARWFLENFDEIDLADICASHEAAQQRAETALREVLATLYPITRTDDPTPLGYQAIHPIRPDDYRRWTAALGANREQP